MRDLAQCLSLDLISPTLKEEVWVGVEMAGIPHLIPVFVKLSKCRWRLSLSVLLQESGRRMFLHQETLVRSITAFELMIGMGYLESLQDCVCGEGCVCVCEGGGR